MFKQRLIVLLALLCLSGTAISQSFQAGNEYRTVDRGQRLSDQPHEVVEFFWYGCGACYAFLPTVESWKNDLADDVAFVRVPAVLNPRWRVHGKAYYVAEALDMVDEVHNAIFDAIHVDGKRLDSQRALRELFVEKGADAEEFDRAFDSFQVDAKLRRAENLARRFAIRATPSVVINGQYVTDPSSAGGPRGIVEVGNWLIEQDRD
ncbi:thiol:disulfide interchange protein DsbA/DsbL [Natronospira bacteriovora]|uniref:Thiol:disulfide interchange protein n=1 Tax=Natronospira bacteriovora TaxID=3069753 RepID=A0ABU0W7S2_9GAMM|nr:thiol:disulfide interchange protein DsbA/DsbL [Natronospira sp. AB-CW4]MDQ2069808.1 thiol:disulfide interchange protein DsbA/DsbL [Natronospira sp. AB-CW4]